MLYIASLELKLLFARDNISFFLNLLCDMLTNKSFSVSMRQTRLNEHDRCVIGTLLYERLHEQLRELCDRYNGNYWWWGSGNEEQVLTRRAQRIKDLTSAFINTLPLLDSYDRQAVGILLAYARRTFNRTIATRRYFRYKNCGCYQCNYKIIFVRFE